MERESGWEQEATTTKTQMEDRVIKDAQTMEVKDWGDNAGPK